MALQIRFLPPTDLTPLPAAYARIVLLALDDSAQTGRVGFAVYRSKAEADGGCQPVGQYQFTLPPQAIPEQRDARGNVTAPAFPAYAAVVAIPLPAEAAGLPVGEVVKMLLYTFFKTRPEFAGAEDV
jgi:hypothetical protein